MANWSNPTLTSLYTDFVNEVKNRDVDLALGLDPATTSPTNIPTNALRWNSANKRWEKYDGTNWNALSTAFSIPLGTQGSPSIYFDTDTNTGLYSPGADQVAISTGGTGRLFVDSAGRMGLGTSSPAQLLHIKGSGDAKLLLNSSNNTSDRGIYFATSTDSEVLGYIKQEYLTGKFEISSGSGSYSSSISFRTGGTADRVVIDSSGNLGLGLTPSAWGINFKALQIAPTVAVSADVNNGSGRFGTNWYQSGSGGGTPRYIENGISLMYLQNKGGGAHEWYTALPGTAGDPITFTQAMTLDASGRLLVGTSSARTPLTHSPSLQVEGVGYAPSTISVIGNSNDINGSYIFIGKSRGTSVGSNTIVQSGDEIGGLDFIATDGTQALRAARITAHVDGTPGTNDMPGRLLFYTTADGAASPTERLRLDSIGTASFAGAAGNMASPVVQFHGNAGAGSLLIDSSGYITSKSGRIPAKQYYRLDSAFTGTNGTAAQPIYGVGVTLIGSTVYEFEAIYAFSRSTGSTSHTMSFLFGGTATINNIFYTGVGPGDGILPPLSTYDGGPASFVATSAGASVATAAMTIGTGIFYIVKGTVSINAGGTFIPQYQLSAAPGGAYSTYAGAYFSIWPLAASGAAVNIGSWA